MKYLIDKYSKDDALYPKDLKQRALVDARLDFDNGTLWPKVRGIYVSTLKFIHEKKNCFLFSRKNI